MEDGMSNYVQVNERDIMEMVIGHWTADEAESALPALEKARVGFAKGRDYHLEVGEMCQQKVDTLDTIIAVAKNLKQEQAVQESVHQPPKADLRNIRCGNATADDILDCAKYRHALWPIARRNDGIVVLADATNLILAVMKPHGKYDSMKGALGKFMRTDPRWERVTRGQYRLLEVGNSEDEKSTNRRAGKDTEGCPARKAA